MSVFWHFEELALSTLRDHTACMLIIKPADIYSIEETFSSEISSNSKANAWRNISSFLIVLSGWRINGCIVITVQKGLHILTMFPYILTCPSVTFHPFPRQSPSSVSSVSLLHNIFCHSSVWCLELMYLLYQIMKGDDDIS